MVLKSFHPWKSFLLFILSSSWLFAQHGIGTVEPSKNAALDITSSNGGLLIPRISLTSSSTFAPLMGPATSHDTGMLVFNTASTTLSGQGFYFWDGTYWRLITDENNTSTPSLAAPLSFGASSTLLQSTLSVQGTTPVTLQASGSIRFSQTGTHTLLLSTVESIPKMVADTDSNTHIQVEKNNDENSIRFTTAGNERLQIPATGQLLFANPGDFTGNNPTTAVVGIEGTNHGRLRLTAGSADTQNDSQGASIDLHGNSATQNHGILDLIAGSNAYHPAMRFWTNDGQRQHASMVINGEGEVGIGTVTPTAVLDVVGGIHLNVVSTTHLVANNDLTYTAAAINQSNNTTTNYTQIFPQSALTSHTFAVEHLVVSFQNRMLSPSAPHTDDISQGTTSAAAGLFVGNSTEIIANSGIPTTIWVYLVDNTTIAAIELRFRLNGNQIEVTEIDSRSKTGTGISAAQRNATYFTNPAEGWTSNQNSGNTLDGGFNLDKFNSTLKPRTNVVKGDLKFIHLHEQATLSNSDFVLMIDKDNIVHQVPATEFAQSTAATPTLIADTDGDTRIDTQSGTTDTDALRFTTAGTERLVIDSDGDVTLGDPGAFNPIIGNVNSRVVGLGTNSTTTHHGRLRLTAGSQDTRSDAEGASIDLHGNATGANTGKLDLIGGSAASGNTTAIRFWTNNGLQQQQSGVITGDGRWVLGTTTTNTNAALDITSSDRGLLIPRISLTSSSTFAPLVGPATTDDTGMLVFNTTSTTLSGQGFYFWDGNHWRLLTGEHNASTSVTPLSFGVSSSVSQSTIGVQGTTPLTLQASGSLRLSQTGTHTLQFYTIEELPNILTDTDSDTRIEVEKNSDEDMIRFTTAGTERMVIDSDGDVTLGDPGAFNPMIGNVNSRVVGLGTSATTTHHGRLRLTSGSQDTRSDAEGASIDLHGNATGTNTGKLDLIGGSAASGNTTAIRFWTNNGLQQQQSGVITGDGRWALGTTTPNTSAILDLTNTLSAGLLLPQESSATNVSSATDGMLVYDTGRKDVYLRAENAWKPLSYSEVTNELLFDGKDQNDTNHHNYYYVSMVVNGNWKVIRYHRSLVNQQAEATNANNTSVTSQPTTLAACVALTF